MGHPGEPGLAVSIALLILTLYKPDLTFKYNKKGKITLSGQAQVGSLGDYQPTNRGTPAIISERSSGAWISLNNKQPAMLRSPSGVF